MNADLLKKLLEAGDVEKTITVFDTHCLAKNIQDAIKQYFPDTHAVKNEAIRKKKEIKNAEGVVESLIEVARLPLPIQKKIVLVAAAFLGNPEVESTPNGVIEENLLEITTKVLSDNKMDYRFKAIAKHTMAEKQCAELWYTQGADADYWEGFPMKSNYRLRMKLLAKSLGDTLYPVFDAFGDMLAFGRAYEIEDVKENGQQETTKYFDVYTADRIYYAKQVDAGAWEVNSDVDLPALNHVGDKLKGVPNPIKKIPVIYYCQPFTEWHDVQPLIERLETKISNHADTNDYFDSPIVVAMGTVTGFSNKGEQGKLLEADNNAKVEYLTWDNAPESMKMEIENLLKFIHAFTHTPDISFENMKGLGVFSGIALKMLFLDAHLKAADKEEIFGEGVQRRLNYIKSAIAVLDPSFKAAMKLLMKPKFTYFLPENVSEQLDVLIKAVEAKLLSRESAVEQNPLITNLEEEKDRLESEKEEAAALIPVPKPIPLPVNN